MNGKILMIYLICSGLIGFIIVGADKRRARKGMWRVPERSIFTIAFLGGAFGVWAGMLLFRHKTRHKSFKYGIPAICAAWLVIIIFLIRRR